VSTVGRGESRSWQQRNGSSTPLMSPERRATAASAPGPRRRSWGLVAFAALLVLGSALAVAAWGLHAGDRVSVLAVAKPIPRGHVIERADLVSQSVSGVDGAVPLDATSEVVGSTTTVDLVAGQILTKSMLTTAPLPAAGQSVVGLALDASRVPTAGLEPGDWVDVLAVPTAEDQGPSDQAALDAPQVIAEGASVFAVDEQLNQSGQMTLTLVVGTDEAARLAAYSTQNRVAVIEVAPPSDVASGDDAQ
jgi:hypothetical protein